VTDAVLGDKAFCRAMAEILRGRSDGSLLSMVPAFVTLLYDVVALGRGVDERIDLANGADVIAQRWLAGNESDRPICASLAVAVGTRHSAHR
jgi:hypothetical protein